MGRGGGAVAEADAILVITKRLLYLVKQVIKLLVPFNIVEFRAVTLSSSALISVGSRCVAATRHTNDTSAPPFCVIDRSLILSVLKYPSLAPSVNY